MKLFSLRELCIAGFDAILVTSKMIRLMHFSEEKKRFFSPKTVPSNTELHQSSN